MWTTTFWQLELLQLHPAYFAALSLGIPDDAPGPDLLKECQFELDCFRRLQLPDGSCRYGIETDGDPAGGQVSWLQDKHIYVYAPDALSSYVYAAVAARAAEVLAGVDAAKAAIYRDGAVAAMRWAESRKPTLEADGTWKRHREMAQYRQAAAVCLYASTRVEAWNRLFLAATTLAGDDHPSFRGDTPLRAAAVTYARLPEGLGDATVKANARHAIIADADGSLAYEAGNAFGIASDDVGKPQFIGFYSNPHGAVSLVRAYQLTGEERYLVGAIRACLFPAGANPSNLVYTSGLGSNPVKAMNMDALATGQPAPIGLTPYGNIDLQRWASHGQGGWITWPITWFVGKHTQPDCYAWPTSEAYWDVRFWPAYNEFCVDQTMGPNAYVWGSLAARGSQ
jgi:endoglucanase